MAEATIPVDLLNPGQVFACLGIVEVADILLGDARGAFDWSGEEQGTRFRVAAGGDDNPVERVMEFLEEAEIVARAPAGSGNIARWKKSWGREPECDERDAPFPFPDPSSPATLPVVLRDKHGREITVEYWGDATRRDNVKFWAGSGGYPGVALLRDAQALARGMTRQHASAPFALSVVQTSSFRFDWRRDYIPIDAGFSPNKHGGVSMVGFPVVEILAAIGVSHARPKRSGKLEYRYGVIGGGAPLDPIFLRAALGAESAPIPGAKAPFRSFVMRLGYPGQEDQARCITQVKEVAPSDQRSDSGSLQ